MQGNRSHLAFSGGPHECPGQDIGRAIADVGVDALLMRLPDLQLDCAEDELRWTASISSRHLVELPVTFAPKDPQDVSQRPSLRPLPRADPAAVRSGHSSRRPRHRPRCRRPRPPPRRNAVLAPGSGSCAGGAATEPSPAPGVRAGPPVPVVWLRGPSPRTTTRRSVPAR